jgi:hypothetical protein
LLSLGLVAEVGHEGGKRELGFGVVRVGGNIERVEVNGWQFEVIRVGNWGGFVLNVAVGVLVEDVVLS